uniref:mRNA interferase RelE/StbE n=2 Tax=Candidatus Kentrum sp. MB TaxID=2138164 RepID=A0A450X2X2_9GAMM|nr:MAG: mRNA interferase RelE/StbE [Candidatus Kentron sp. MB]VFK27983.1 MAG: mRNA interferase RelE/StbE [Candidatus Kentron sp. MB]
MYTVVLMPKAIKDFKKIPKSNASKIVEKLQNMENELCVDVKKLTNFTPEYRLRIGNYRALFEVEENQIVVYRIKHRKEAYISR